MYIKSLVEFKNPLAMCKNIAQNAKQRRLEKNMTQEFVAQKSGVSYASLRKFEKTGEISLHSLVKIAIALDMFEELTSLFSQPQYSSMDELLTSKMQKNRKRARNHE